MEEDDDDMNMGFMLEISKNPRVNNIIFTSFVGMLADSFHNVADPEIDIGSKKLDEFGDEFGDEVGDEVGAPHKPLQDKSMYA